MAITSSTITRPQLEQCLKLYPKLVEKVYDSRIKDGKKCSEAKARDEWRYVELPKELSGSKAMSLAQLERLVQWKITHGQARPFLPAMIRKSTGEAVTSATKATAAKLSALDSSSSVEARLKITLSALETVSELKGVGPATASLILSVYSPDDVPFFQDELFAWCVPDKAGAKLKYDKKEYIELFNGTQEVRQRLGHGTRMVELEKASFVLQHQELLDEAEKQTLESDESASAKAEKSNPTEADEVDESPADEAVNDKKSKKSEKKRQPASTAVSDETQRRSKRAKK